MSKTWGANRRPHLLGLLIKGLEPWRQALRIVRPETVVSWQRKGFRLFWSWISKRKRRGRPEVSSEIRAWIGRMGEANPFWAALRIHGELLKLGLEVWERTVSRLMPKSRKPPSQTWRAFLHNHLQELVAIDFFTVPTAGFRVLFVLVVLAHPRRQVIHFKVTEHPRALWTGQQGVEAFPDDTAPRYLLRDRDQIYGNEFRQRVQGLGIREVKIAPQSPWQNPFAERRVGSIRRECLDHVMVLGEKYLRKILTSYLAYDQGSRPHLALGKEAPEPRAVQPSEAGPVIELPQVGGLHHRYERGAT